MIREVIEKLSNEESSPSAVEIARLSGLAPKDAGEFRDAWSGLPSERRRAVLHVAVQLAENDVELDFSTVFTVCLSDQDDEVRATAIEGLWESEDFRTADQLARLLRSDAAERVRVAAALGLARFALLAELGSLYQPAAARVRRALETAATDPGETVEVRRRAIEAIAAFSDSTVTELIETAYASADPKMRASAIYAMGRNCDDRWLEVILRELENEDPEMRFEAARAAGQLENSRAIVPLIALLDDPDLEVRLAAIGALGEIGGDVARKALQRCAQSKDAAIRAAANDALDELALSADPLSISPFLRRSTRTI